MHPWLGQRTKAVLCLWGGTANHSRVWGPWCGNKKSRPRRGGPQPVAGAQHTAISSYQYLLFPGEVIFAELLLPLRLEFVKLLALYLVEGNTLILALLPGIPLALARGPDPGLTRRLL